LPYHNPFLHLAETILATCIIGTLIGAKQRVPILRSRFLLLIGDTSYSIYLFHYVVLCILAKMFAVIHLDLDLVPLSLLLASMTCLITVPLAWASYTYIEKPGIALGKRSLRQMRLASAS
jgi:peptidoglycan/LPS O-acetylase OafA/YrhL